MKAQRGGFVMGLVAGLLVGLALALGVALYITKAPVPFINKVPQRTAEQDTAETERNRTWDPNAPLAGKGAPRGAAAPSGVATAPTAPAAAASPVLPPGIATAPVAVPGVPGRTGTAASAPAARSARDPAAILASGGNALPGADPFVYFVQAGAFTRSEDAEQQRARLAMIGQTAKVTEREQSGRTVYRVRLGPFPTRDEADGLQSRLQEQTIESQIVRVERP